VSFVLFVAAAIGGAMNAVAGGGSFLTLPALIVSGVSPVVANATSTLALWPASVSSAVAYRHELRSSRQWLAVLAADQWPRTAGVHSERHDLVAAWSGDGRRRDGRRLPDRLIRANNRSALRSLVRHRRRLDDDDLFLCQIG
jgi:hypothetical protein